MKILNLLYNNHQLYRQMLALQTLPEGYERELVEVNFTSENHNKTLGDSDIERLLWMQKNPNDAYLDLDVLVCKKIDFELEPGYPYLGYTCGLADIWCIIGNGCQQFFDDLMDVYYSYSEPPPQYWAHRLIRGDWKDRVRIIPEGYFRHLNFSALIGMAARGHSVSNEACNLKFVNGEWKLKIFK